MKQYLKLGEASLLIIIVLFLTALPVQARQLSDIKFEFTNENSIERICRINLNWKPVGCFLAPDTIVLRIDDYIPARVIIQSLWHEIGHWLAVNITLEQYQNVFGNYSLEFLREETADEFALMITDKSYVQKMPAERIKFFAGVIK